MKPWRTHSDPWEQADDLGLSQVCRNMGWTKRRLTNELERVASPEAFKLRVHRALKELDRPRLLTGRSSARPPCKCKVQPCNRHGGDADSDDAKGYTDSPHLALRGEPEAVPEEVQDQISKDAWQGFSDARRRYNEKRKQKDVCARLQLVQADAVTRGVDINSGLRMVERALERMERKVDRCDVAA